MQGKRVEIGSFDKLEDAVAAYERVAKEQRGEYHPALDTRLRPLYNNTHKTAQAYRELAIPFGAVTQDSKGQNWVFVGWSPTTVSHEAVLIRELQPGERIGPVNPWTYHCTETATLLRRYPMLEQYRIEALATAEQRLVAAAARKEIGIK
jgi:hypothetical protein